MHLWVIRLFFPFVMICASARAHDPFSITATAHVDQEPTFTVRITFSRSVAVYLIGRVQKPNSFFAAADYAKHEAQLAQLAPTLCSLRSGGTALKLIRSSVQLTRDEDIEYTLIFSKPSPGRVSLEACWFKKLTDDGYAATLMCSGGSDFFAGPFGLDVEHPMAEFTLTPAAFAPVSSLPEKAR